MRLPRPWMSLPFACPAEAFAAIARTADEGAWRAVDGTGQRARLELFDGATLIEAASAVAPWMASLDVVWADAALLRFASGAHTPLQVDARRVARDRLQIILPLTAGWLLEVDGARMPLDASRGGVLDTWQRHRLAQLSDAPGFALVAEVYGDLQPRAAEAAAGSRRARDVMSAPNPWEIESLIGGLIADVPPQDAQRVHAPLARFVRGWRGEWASADAGDDARRRAAWIAETRAALDEADARRIPMRNGLGFAEVLERHVLEPLTRLDDAVTKCATSLAGRDPEFDRPVFIVSPPRAGSTLLFETLAQAKGVVTIGDESHTLIEGLPSLAPAARNYQSNVLDACDATPAVAAALRTRFMDQLRDRDGHRVDGMSPVRMLEKTPKNALRIPFLRAVFPEARFIYLHRDPHQVIASMIESWTSGRFNTYPTLPGWSGPPWSLLLVPGWRELVGRSLADVVGHQWATTVQTMLDDLAALPSDRVLGVDYATLLANPDAELRRICAWAGFEWDRSLEGELPLSRYTMSKPDASKWRRHQADVAAQLAPRAGLVARAGAAVHTGP
ncbi:sulfotransferase family protein [Cognatilysobacter terrigena]|uniref:sulfotransferase family protein n=1 Tax=Cognatilysobacter terrigena TaxID=2488749 RepID=UPI00105C0AE5|nr:sulfotransferase [Lysobacter terrigena]